MGTKITFLAVMLISLIGAPARVLPQSSQAQWLAQLESTLQDCAWKVQTTTGGPKGLMLLHQAKMKTILEELREGRSVESKVIEAVMKEHAS